MSSQRITISDYDPAWPVLYEELRAPLAEAFGHHAVDIQHVGSTSVPGLAAKPIIDIAVAIDRYPLPDEVIARVEALGYEHRGEFGIPRRHYFNGPGSDGRPTVHIHANELHSPAYQNHILFRDYLRTHKDAAHEYAALKKQLADSVGHDRELYTDSKTEFVLKALARATTWREESEDKGL